jgi:hypothetical protein
VECGLQCAQSMGEKRKHRNGRHGSDSDDGDVRHTVDSLKRRHQQEAVLAGEEAPATLFWSKKVERDLKSGASAKFDAQQLAREREAELQRVRARRCGHRCLRRVHALLRRLLKHSMQSQHSLPASCRGRCAARHSAQGEPITSTTVLLKQH